DLQQVTFPAQTPLCFGPGNPPTAVPKTVVAISAVSQNGSNTTYSYVVNSGLPLAVGETIVIAGMQDGGNDGTYTMLSLGPATFGFHLRLQLSGFRLSASAHADIHRIRRNTLVIPNPFRDEESAFSDTPS